MRSVTAALVIALALGASGPRAVDAQTIRGRVLDASTEEPIPGVTVRLASAAGLGVTAAYTTAEGVFELDAPHGGNFLLVAERIGYPRVTTPQIIVLPAEVVEVTIRMDPRAIQIAPLTVEVRTGGNRGRDQFERRCALGTGRCMDPIEVASIEAPFPSVLFQDVRGVRADPMIGGVVRRLGGGCMVTFMNNDPTPITNHTPRHIWMTVGLGAGSNYPTRPSLVARMTGAGGGFFNNALDNRIPRGAIRAIEVYLDYEDIPEEARGGPREWYLWPDDRNYIGGRCGAIIIWTWDQW